MPINDFQKRVSSWYSEAMATMTWWQEEKEKLRKAITVENLKNEEHYSDRIGLRRQS